MLEVGEYVRIRDGQIVKLENNEEFYEDSVDVGIGIIPAVDGIWIDKEYLNYIEKEEIVKHSKNIIDLIEPGDLVRIFVEENVNENGTTEDTCVYEVTATQVKDFYGNKLEEIGIVGEDGTELIPFANVRGIVTREQFASMEYKVKEEIC